MTSQAGTEYEIDAIRASLHLDPRIPDSSAIVIYAGGGTVYLQGAVASFAERRAALQDAVMASSSINVVDNLKVQPLPDWLRKDADIRAVALQILAWDIEVPAEAVDLTVKDGHIVLDGEVNHQFQREAAFDDVGSLRGVVGVTNRIRVRNS